MVVVWLRILDPYWCILTTVTLVSTNNMLPDDGVSAPKHVGAVLI
jgi:hypothetical protein